MQEIPHIRYLYVVKEVFRHRRISAAADVVHLSQPAATQSLARVENLLKARLFERHPQGMFPTEVGKIFEPRLERIIEHLRRGDSLARKKASKTADQTPRASFHKFCSPVQLRALLAIWKTGSFSLAAAELGVSQPGVHRAMRELAALSGLMLFDQTRRGVVLTASAEVFVHQVSLAINEFRQAIFEINEHLGCDVTRINVGSLPLSRTAILPEAMDRLLNSAVTAVQISCVDARYPTLLRDLRFGELDFLIGALRFPNPAKDVEQEELFVDHLAIVVAPDHPLTKLPTVTLQDALAFPWIAPPKATPSGAYLYEKLRIQELPDSPVRIVSSSLLMLCELLTRGNYVSIASKHQIAAEEHIGRLVQLPIELPESGRAIGLTFRTGWRPTPVQKAFLDIIRDSTDRVDR